MPPFPDVIYALKRIVGEKERFGVNGKATVPSRACQQDEEVPLPSAAGRGTSSNMTENGWEGMEKNV